MPYGKQFEAIRSHSVVDPIPNAIKVDSPHVGRTCLLNAHAYARLQEQNVDSSLQILANCAWRGGSVSSPPPDDALKLARGAAR